MSELLKDFLGKQTVSTGQSKLPSETKGPALVRFRYQGKDYPIHTGVTFVIPEIQFGTMYNMEMARRIFQLQHPPALLRPAHMMPYAALQQFVHENGEVLWLEGIPKLTHLQWVKLSTHSPATPLKGALVMLLSPQMPEAQTMPGSYPWMGVIDL